MRHTIYIERNSLDESGNYAREHCHLVTLSNETAVNMVMEYLQSLGWLEGIVSIDDILIYDPILD